MIIRQWGRGSLSVAVALGRGKGHEEVMAEWSPCQQLGADRVRFPPDGGPDPLCLVALGLSVWILARRATDRSILGTYISLRGERALDL